MRRSTVLLILSAALIAAGCSSRTGSGEGPNSNGIENVGAPTTTTSPAASVEQFASIVAEHRGKWDDQVDTTKEDCLDPNTAVACGLGYMALGLQAETLNVVLTGVHKTGSPTYVGEPPAEIKNLLNETERAAGAVNPAVEEFQQAGCIDPMDEACLTEYVAMDSAVDELSRKLDAWSAY